MFAYRQNRIIGNSLNIPEVAEYKYFGITINQTITTKSHSEIIKSKVLSLKEDYGY